MRVPTLVLGLALSMSSAAAQHNAMHQGPATTHVLAAAREAAAAIPDTAAARAAGYRPIEELGIPDRNPFQGQHWFRGRSDTLPEVSLDAPAFVMFSPVNGTLHRIAVAYSTRLRLETPNPEALGGDSSAMWHQHVLCGFKSSSGRPIVDQVPDTAVCRVRGGEPRPRKTVMVHVWTDVANPEGVYGHDNPALPFIALGLTPPAMSSMHDPVSFRQTRELALSLGESYGARLENGYLIEQANADSALADSLRAHRAAISALLPELRRADAAHDARAYDRVATRIRAHGKAIEHVYEQMAKPDALADLRRQYESILTTSAMH